VAGGTALEDQSLALETITGLARDGVLAEAPRALVEQVFVLEQGDTAALAGPDTTAYVVRVDAVVAANPDAPEVEQTTQALTQSMTQGLAQDIFEAYGQAVQTEAGLTVNQQALNAVHASIGTQGGL
jgi:peptidyl-prolyl cis-trans isomerase D